MKQCGIMPAHLGLFIGRVYQEIASFTGDFCVDNRAWQAAVMLFLLQNNRRCFPISTKKELELNEEIRDKEVRVITSDGEQLGVMSGRDAYHIALEKGMDLVKIAPQAVPPVCKIMDYGKYRFEQAKREKEAKKNQHVIEVKEIRMSPSIGENDFSTKLRAGQKFLADGDRLKVTIRFRGREMAHTNIGEQLLKSYAEQCANIANMDKNPKLEGRNMSMFLSPKAK